MYLENKTTFKGVGDLSQVISTIVDETNKAVPRLKKFSQQFITNDLEKTSYFIWKYIKDNIKYVRDLIGIEQIRTPERLLSDKIGDCEDYSIFAASILKNLGYNPKFLVVAMDGGYQHIYVIAAPKPHRSDPSVTRQFTTVIDGVMNQFNQHPDDITKYMIIDLNKNKKYKKGSPMNKNLSGTPIHVLSGNYNANPQEDPILTAIDNLSGLGTVENETVEMAKDMHQIEQLEEATTMLQFMEVEQEFSETLEGWIQDKINAAKKKAEELKRKLAEKAKAAAQKRKETAKAAARKAKALLEKAKKGVKKAKDPIKKYGLAPVRGAFLLLVKVNFLRIAKKLYVGYISERKAKELNLDMAVYKKAVAGRIKAEETFEKFGGQKSVLKKAVLTGKNEKRFEKGIPGHNEGLGEPITIATVTAAIGSAIPILKPIMDKIGKVNFAKLYQTAKKIIPGGKKDDTSKGKEQEEYIDYDDDNNEQKNKLPLYIAGGVGLLAVAYFVSKK